MAEENKYSAWVAKATGAELFNYFFPEEEKRISKSQEHAVHLTSGYKEHIYSIPRRLIDYRTGGAD